MSSKQREALNQILGLIDNEILVFNDGLDLSESTNAQYQLDKADEALAEPLRNCDVGTAEEQAERFDEFCLVHWGTNDMSGENCRHCPLSPFNCKLEWAKMPYESEVNNAKK